MAETTIDHLFPGSTRHKQLMQISDVYADAQEKLAKGGLTDEGKQRYQQTIDDLLSDPGYKAELQRLQTIREDTAFNKAYPQKPPSEQPPDSGSYVDENKSAHPFRWPHLWAFENLVKALGFRS